jgi:putative membrane protein
MTGKSYAVAALAAGVALCATGLAQQQQGNLSDQDRRFLQEMSEGNRAEVQLGRMAEQKASNPRVKEFGQRMANDHSKLQNQLSDFASARKVVLPSSTTTEQQNMVTQLSGLSGEQFDRQYMQTMMQEHQKDIAKVQQLMASTQDPAMEDLARRMLPFLENHVRIAEHIAGELRLPVEPGLNQPIQP